jgi:hypothetical protein
MGKKSNIISIVQRIIIAKRGGTHEGIHASRPESY